MTDGFGFLVVVTLFNVFICWLVAHIALFIIFTLAHKKYHLFASKHFVIGIVCGGIASSVLGSLLGYILRAVGSVKIFAPLIFFGSISILSFFLVWCYICLLTYSAYKKQESKKVYKTRHFFIIVCLSSMTMFLSSFYLSYKLG